MQYSTDIARHLLEIKAVKLNPREPFTWASGLLSPIYCDNRISLSFPAVRNFIVQGLVEHAATFKPFDVVAGVATAGIPHGMLVADRMHLPFVYVRSSAKEHGRRNLIEGELTGKERVLVVEDLISTGGSSLQAVQAIQATGCTVVAVIAIFQYGFEKARQAFEDAGVKFETLTDYQTLIQEAASRGYVSSEDLKTLEKWRENPEGWGALYA